MIHKLEKRYNEDSQGYNKSMKSFMKTAQKGTSGNYSTIQRALLTFAKDLVFKNGKGRNVLEFLYKVQLGREEQSIIEEEDLA